MCPKKRFVCEECDKSFPTNYKIKRHINAVHRKERPEAHVIQPEPKAKGPKPKIRPVCECGQDFCDKSKLSRHIRTKHNYEYPFSCNECNKSFRDGPSLQRHMLVHSGERRFACEECSERFKLKQHLQVHVFSVHKKATYYCTEEGCCKTYSSKAALSYHLRVIHRGIRYFKCHQCGLEFGKGQALVDHLKVHFGNESTVAEEECPNCGRKFLNLNQLNEHLKREQANADDYEFTCAVCSGKFFTQFELDFHKLSHSQLNGDLLEQELVRIENLKGFIDWDN